LPEELLTVSTVLELSVSNALCPLDAAGNIDMSIAQVSRIDTNLCFLFMKRPPRYKILIIPILSYF
jgi:hypothetical protein